MGLLDREHQHRPDGQAPATARRRRRGDACRLPAVCSKARVGVARTSVVPGDDAGVRDPDAGGAGDGAVYRDADTPDIAAGAAAADPAGGYVGDGADVHEDRVARLEGVACAANWQRC